jgi:carbamoyltransferase
MKILGLNAASHNTSATLLVDGQLVAFAEEERFNREKYTMAFPEQSLRYCLDQGGVALSEIDLVAFAGDPGTEIVHSMIGAIRLAGRPWYRTWLRNQALVTGAFKGTRQVRKLRGRLGYTGAVRTVNHHLCHASSAFHCSPYESAAILTLDAQGDGMATGIYVGEGTEIRKVESFGFPEHSIGHMYDVVAEWLGFRPVLDAGKVMGLASYGDPTTHIEKFERFCKIASDGTVRFDLDRMKHEHDTQSSRSFVELFGPPRALGESPTDPRFADVAAGAQAILERAVLALARRARELTGQSRLCMAGGVALNSVANGKLSMERVFDEIWVQPAANDAGLALGAGLQAWHDAGGDRRFVMKHAYWGPDTETEEVRETIEVAKAQYREVDDPSQAAAELVADGKIVGWYQGRSEVGPRSLGGRSILANPRLAEMKDVVNRYVKHREPFRPFAPSCVLEEADRWFEQGGPSPFMLKVWTVRPETREKLPAITHVDGSARLQTVTAEEHPAYHRYLVELGKRTGIPCTLNTSFNIRGEPIVNTPMDALKCYFTTGLDALVIDRFVLEKPATAG